MAANCFLGDERQRHTHKSEDLKLWSSGEDRPSDRPRWQRGGKSITHEPKISDSTSHISGTMMRVSGSLVWLGARLKWKYAPPQHVVIGMLAAFGRDRSPRQHPGSTARPATEHGVSLSPLAARALTDSGIPTCTSSRLSIYLSIKDELSLPLGGSVLESRKKKRRIKPEACNQKSRERSHSNRSCTEYHYHGKSRDATTWKQNGRTCVRNRCEKAQTSIKIKGIKDGINQFLHIWRHCTSIILHLESNLI